MALSDITKTISITISQYCYLSNSSVEALREPFTSMNAMALRIRIFISAFRATEVLERSAESLLPAGLDLILQNITMNILFLQDHFHSS